MSHHQNAGQRHDIKTANRSFENAAKPKHLGTDDNKAMLDTELHLQRKVGAVSTQKCTLSFNSESSV
jgi:hypothetical protein